MVQAKIPKFSIFQREKLATLGILKWKIPTLGKMMQCRKVSGKPMNFFKKMSG
jgi:hypothetical protein